MAFQGQLRMGGGVSILFSLLAKSSTMGEKPLFCLHISSYLSIFEYRKVASSNTSRFKAHAGFFRLSIKGIFDAYVL